MKPTRNKARSPGGSDRFIGLLRRFVVLFGTTTGDRADGEELADEEGEEKDEEEWTVRDNARAAALAAFESERVEQADILRLAAGGSKDKEDLSVGDSI